ncbi:MAG: ATP-binding protein [Parvibaculum sp.]
MRVNLICGSTGAGKTTYAQKLADERGAVRFSIDEWMSELFWPDQMPGTDYRWAIERVERCERQIWTVSREVLARGSEVVLDLGFTKREQRERFCAWADKTGAETITHYLAVDAATRRARVYQRNAEKGDTFAFEVTDEMFDFMETIFEPPTGEEGTLKTVTA